MIDGATLALVFRYIGIVSGLCHHDFVRGAMIADARPVDGVSPFRSEHTEPVRRRIHVEEKFHTETKGRSFSSERHAA